MSHKWAVFAVVALAMGSLSNVSATEDAPDTSEGCAAFPPCGYINPYLSLELPTNVPCRNDETGEGCMAPPTAGEPQVFEGEFLLTWDITEEGTYAADPDDPVVVTFNPTGSAPSFLKFSIEPETFTLDATTLNNPSYYVEKERPDGSNSVWYEYREPVKVTMSRDGDPSMDDIQRMHVKDGEVQFIVRIHSDSSGSTYKDSYGLELFSYHIGATEAGSDAAIEELQVEVMGIEASPSQGAPSVAVPATLAALGAAAVALRRRTF